MPRRTSAVYEAKNRFSEPIAAGEQREEIAIARRGAPVARLLLLGATDATKAQQRRQVRSAMAQRSALGADGALGCALVQAIQEVRDEWLLCATTRNTLSPEQLQRRLFGTGHATWPAAGNTR